MTKRQGIFINVGERTNVTGSAKFKRLILNGEYDESPEEMTDHIREWAESGLLNIVGGCCGTTPDHIKTIADAVSQIKTRKVPVIEPQMRLCGLEPFKVI